MEEAPGQYCHQEILWLYSLAWSVIEFIKVIHVVPATQVSTELLGLSLGATLSPTGQQRRLWTFLNVLTIIFLCTLMHGQHDHNLVKEVGSSLILY